MIDDVYKNAFKEVYDILGNTENELLEKIPIKFMDFIKDNMNVNFKSNIRFDEPIDKQQLLTETEAILSLIYRSYWATEAEKQEFAMRDQENFFEIEKKKKNEYQGKDIYQIFEERKNINKITIDNNLLVIEKENFIKRFFNKILGLFRKRNI